MAYVTILNFATGEVNIIHYTDEDIPEDSSIEEFITDKGHSIKDCHYMTTDQLLLNIS